MSLPGLKSTIELETTPALRLIDRASGVSLAVSETEVRLLQLWDGVSSATELSARVFVEGLDVEPWQVEQFFTRLTRSGLLAAQTPVVPDFVQAPPGVEHPEDTVPKLRGDLIIARSPQSRGTLEVKDPRSERAFTLYDFEVSIARMLDGRRSASEVLAAANRLGIPVTLATLRTFLQQLRAYRFIDESITEGDTTWPRRQQWTAEVRELYQSALRLLRQGRYDEALGYVEAMQQADPANEEARTLRQRIETEAKGSLELKVDFEALHTPVPETVATAAPQPAGTGDPFAAFGFLTQPPSAAELPPLPPALAAPAPVAMEELPSPEGAEAEQLMAPPSRRKRALLLGAVGALVVVGVLFRPVHVQQSVAAELRAREVGVPRAPLAGKVLTVEVKSGAAVEQGAVLARLELANPVAGVEQELATLEQSLAALPAPADGVKVTKARAALKKAQGAVTALEKQRKKATSKKAVAALEKKLKPKQKALEAAQAALEALTHEGERARLTEALRERSAKKVAATVEAERAVITAPVAGVFIGEDLPAKVEVDGAFGRVVAPQLEVVLSAPLQTRAASGRFRAPAGELDVAVSGGALSPVPLTPALMGARGTLELDEGSAPWLFR